MKWAASRRALSKLADVLSKLEPSSLHLFPDRAPVEAPALISSFFLSVDIFFNIDIHCSVEATERLGSVERRSRAGRSRSAIIVFRAARDADRADHRSILDDRQAAAEQDHARAEGDPVVDHRIVFQGV